MTETPWNWQKKDWPNFTYNVEKLEELEDEFLHESGKLAGAVQHIAAVDMAELNIEIMSDEALQTSEIEGEYLNRDSVRSSIKANLGFGKTARNMPAEQGIADMMFDIYQNYKKPLTNEMLFYWHERLTLGRRDLQDIGCYRTHQDAMQIISGPINKPNVHFEAPPSAQVSVEMQQFIKWFNESAELPILTRAAVAHLYFITIHPFEDGNGRIARALVEKSLSESLGYNSLVSLSLVINKNKKQYYQKLAESNHSNEITDWLIYFAEVILEAERYSYQLIEFVIRKAKVFNKFKDDLNERQAKVINRLFKAGPEGFKGGLSAENYLSLTKTSRATATRDLQDLVAKRILRKTGQRKSTRYFLEL